MEQNGKNQPMKLSKFKVLSNDELDAIYATSLYLLKTVGANIEDEEIRKLLADKGCDIGPHNVVYIPESLVKDCLKSTPNEFTLCGRDPKHDMTVGRQKYPYVSPYVLGPDYCDYLSAYRPLAEEDMRRYLVLCDYLDSIDGVWLTSYIPKYGDMYTYYDYELGIRNTTKPVFVYGLENPRSIDPAYELATEIAGGKDELKRRPVLTIGICASSPLIWSKYQCAMFKAVARPGIVPVITPEAPMGDSSPVTIAGNIAQKIAEFLSGLVIMQVLRKGMPVMMATPHEVLDQKTSAVNLGTHASFVSACAIGQLEKYLGIPIMSPASPDSHLPDMQESYELAFTFLPLMFGGCNLIVFHGLGSAFAINNESLLLLDEMVIAGRRLLDGIEVNCDTLAANVIKDVCSKFNKDIRSGHFVDQKHTLSWYEIEHRPRRDSLIEKHSKAEWERHGSTSYLQRAHERVEEILKTHKPEPLSKEVETRIAEIRRKYKLEA
jgi:trimethylamine--corrinoid protein Co-methyltransferase